MKVHSKFEVRQVTAGRRVSVFSRLAPWTVGVAAALNLAGCGGEAMSEEELLAEMEDVGSVSSALSQSSCATATANFSATGKVDPGHISPRSYDTCHKGYVVDVNNLSAEYTGTGSINARLAVEWADSNLTNQTDCEDHHIRAIYYKKVSGNWVVQQDDTVWGTWIGLVGGGGYCSMQSNLMGLTAGSSYRVAATARTPGGATRKIMIQNYKKVFVT
jgi:hypothetical protein